MDPATSSKKGTEDDDDEQQLIAECYQRSIDGRIEWENQLFVAIEDIGMLLLLTLIVMKIVYKKISKFTLASSLIIFHTHTHTHIEVGECECNQKKLLELVTSNE